MGLICDKTNLITVVDMGSESTGHDSGPCRFRYDACLSFASEDRKYVRQVAKLLKRSGLDIFYADLETIELWGKDLYEHFDEIFRRDARYCIIFISKHYARKAWPTHERRSAQARAMQQNSEYVLPVRFDDTPIPGLRDTVGYIDARITSPRKLAVFIQQKIGTGLARRNYMPRDLSRLYSRLNMNTKSQKDRIKYYASSFFDALINMSDYERKLIYWTFKMGCPAELPNNVHIDIDYLRRVLKKTPEEIKSTFGNLSSLGFSCSARKLQHDDDKEFGREEYIVVEWHDRTEYYGGNVTYIASSIIDVATDQYCREHGLECIRRLNFTWLSKDE